MAGLPALVCADMFAPYRDHLPTRSFPFINYLLIATNVLAFMWEQALIETGYANVVPAYGLIPLQFVHDPVTFAPNVFTSMFMHGGLAHLFGNMLYLWIFGDNVEDAVGHFRYLVFYLLGGIGAALGQVGIDPSSTIPMVGASGAIAAVLAAYVSLYPRSPISVFHMFVPLWFVFGPVLLLPAWVVIGLFFFLGNVLNGITSLSVPGTGGVAFFAHIGGFVAGLILIRIFMVGRDRMQADRWNGWRPPPRAPRQPPRSDPWDSYGR